MAKAISLQDFYLKYEEFEVLAVCVINDFACVCVWQEGGHILPAGMPNETIWFPKCIFWHFLPNYSLPLLAALTGSSLLFGSQTHPLHELADNLQMSELGPGIWNVRTKRQQVSADLALTFRFLRPTNNGHSNNNMSMLQLCELGVTCWPKWERGLLIEWGLLSQCQAFIIYVTQGGGCLIILENYSKTTCHLLITWTVWFAFMYDFKVDKWFLTMQCNTTI